MNKPLKITLITLAIIVGFIALVLLGVKVGEKLIFSSFYSNADKEFKMPGTSDNLVQQGMVYVEEKDLILVCGYMSDNTASRVYTLNRDGKVLSITELKNEDGSDYLGHTGGIEYFEGYVYITEGTGVKDYDGGLDVFLLDDIITGKEQAKKIGRVKTYNNPSCCHIYDGYMLVGEYFREVDYETSDSHRMETPAKDFNTAITMVFKMDKANTANFGMSSEPVSCISTRDAVQGIYTIDDDKIVLSTSWGLSASNLYFYDMSKITKGDAEKKIDALSLPSYYLDSASLTETVKAPPMAEEMLYLDGRLFILNESACNKYIFGKFMSGNYMYSYEIK